MSKNNHVIPREPCSCPVLHRIRILWDLWQTWGLLGWRLICLPKMIINTPYEKTWRRIEFVLGLSLFKIFLFTASLNQSDLALFQLWKATWVVVIRLMLGFIITSTRKDLRIHRAVYWMSICMRRKYVQRMKLIKEMRAVSWWPRQRSSPGNFLRSKASKASKA